MMFLSEMFFYYGISAGFTFPNPPLPITKRKSKLLMDIAAVKNNEKKRESKHCLVG